ncbi:hypothetical protein Sfulv_28890 [Streptomyces fulvorobeus]|uniref:Uncharacterized protein n=1 Tax=Streptomyces fulvorobeus TaxID=284028 RepID=A0A7J0C6T7_9ACTN|nr:hypothetical protein Sfulv_28890 [Streptomyces fulvorobeus]
MGVREVHPGRLDREENLSGARYGGGQFHGCEDVGTTEAAELDCEHAARYLAVVGGRGRGRISAR